MKSLGLQIHPSMAKVPFISMPALQWYAVSTKPHQETLAEANLRRIGVETFCPQLKQQKVVRNKIQSCIGPLFPGYIFARFEINDHYRFILYSRGIKRIVSFGDSPAIVDEGLIDGIRSRLQGGRVLDAKASFCNGQRVRIQEGPLQGLEGIFDREMTGSQRAVLLLKALSYQARVVVNLGVIADL